MSFFSRPATHDADAPILEASHLTIRYNGRAVLEDISFRLVSGGQERNLFNGATPALAGLRGQEAGPYLYQAEEIQVALEVQDDARQPGRKSLLGLAMGPEPTGGLALLWRAEQRVAVVPVDDLGNFTIPDLGPGSYDLILSGPQTEIHIQELQIAH